jgi:hypothetical protein
MDVVKKCSKYDYYGEMCMLVAFGRESFAKDPQPPSVLAGMDEIVGVNRHAPMAMCHLDLIASPFFDTGCCKESASRGFINSVVLPLLFVRHDATSHGAF